MTTHHPLARREGVSAEHIGGELVVVDSRSQQAHALPALAATVWSLCDGNHSVAAIAARTGFSPDQVTDVLAQLRERDLLETAGTDKPIDRRAMLSRTVKLGGAAALAAPILTVALPAAAAHASTLSATYSINGYNTYYTISDGGQPYAVTHNADSVYTCYAGYPTYLGSSAGNGAPSNQIYVEVARNANGSLELTLFQYSDAGSANYTTPDGMTTYPLTGSSLTANPPIFTSGTATLVVYPM